ncbi:MAG TPA: asparagine synthetase B family protein [Pseudomonas sp.]
MAILVHFAEKRFTQSSEKQHARPLPDKHCLLGHHARIDNRSELTAQLGLNGADPQSITIPTLLLLAFERWNTDMFRHIRGDWWLAIWDAHRQSVILAIDPSSPTTLFYAWTTTGQLAFSTSLTDILNSEDIPQDLHEARILSHLLQWGLYRDFLQTEYKAIRQIGSATYNVFKPGNVRTETYWEVAQFHIKQACTSEEYVEEFLKRYRQAVISRIPRTGNAASMLSAGLDSGSVTALTASALMAENRQVHAYTHVPVEEAEGLHLPGKLVNEWPAASQLAAMYPNIKHMAIHSDHVDPVGAATFMLQATGRMQAANLNAAWIHHLFESVRQDGFDTLLGGQAGNIVASWEGGRINLWDLLFRKEWTQVSSYLLQGRQSWPGRLRLLAGDMLRYLNPARDFPSPRFNPTQIAIAHPDLYLRWQRTFEADAMSNAGTMTSHRQFRDQMYPMLTTSHSFSQLAAGAYGITLNDPTCDQNVVEWCLQIPDTEYRNTVHNRLLMRNAMQGIIPESTRTTHIRGLQPADLGYRYSKYRASVAYALDLMHTSPTAAHYLNLSAIKKYWDRAQTSRIPDRNLFDFHRGLQAGLFFLVREGKISSHDF